MVALDEPIITAEEGLRGQIEWRNSDRFDVTVPGAERPRAAILVQQLADPHIAAWTIACVREAATAAGRNPDDISICVAAPAYVGDNLAINATRCGGSAAWSATTWRISWPATARTARTCPPPSPITSSAGKNTTTRTTDGPETCIPSSCRTRSWSGSASSGSVPGTVSPPCAIAPEPAVAFRAPAHELQF